MAAYFQQAAIFALAGGGLRPQGGALTLPPAARPTQVFAAGFECVTRRAFEAVGG